MEGVTFSTEYAVLYHGSTESVDPLNFLDSHSILETEREKYYIKGRGKSQYLASYGILSAKLDICQLVRK